MLQKKSKGLFVELTPFHLLTAVTNGFAGPLTVESLASFPADHLQEGFRSRLQALTQARGRGPSRAHCAVYPGSRFCHRASLDNPARARDPKYLAEILRAQFDLDAEQNTVAVLSPGSGLELEAEKTAQKEVIFCGAGSAEFQNEQDRLVANGVYPESLELGTINNLGGLVSYSQGAGLRSPLLVLEVTAEASGIFIVHEGGLQFSRPIAHGLNHMIPLVQSELGLKDEDSARKLFYSNTFDFTEIGPSLLRRMLKELQASIGYYEVQTGQTVGHFCLTLLPENLQWIGSVLAQSLGVETLQLDYRAWLQSLGIQAGENVSLDTLDNRWLGLFGLMARYGTQPDALQAN